LESLVLFFFARLALFSHNFGGLQHLQGIMLMGTILWLLSFDDKMLSAVSILCFGSIVKYHFCVDFPETVR
jgi:hypothetical protein